LALEVNAAGMHISMTKWTALFNYKYPLKRKFPSTILILSSIFGNNQTFKWTQAKLAWLQAAPPAELAHPLRKLSKTMVTMSTQLHAHHPRCQARFMRHPMSPF
jgi:hypothetical protein